METIDAKVIKELRDKTGASIMMVKKALVEANGEHTRAMEILKSLGEAAARQKESHETAAGRIEAYIHAGARVGVLLELRSETDFVARNEKFAELAHNIALHIAASGASTPEELSKEPYIKDEKQTIEGLIREASASFGENIVIKRFARFEL